MAKRIKLLPNKPIKVKFYILTETINWENALLKSAHERFLKSFDFTCTETHFSNRNESQFCGEYWPTEWIFNKLRATYQ